MEQLATPGAIMVSAYIHRLTDGYFTFKDLGVTQIKGVEEPLQIYEVVGVGQLRTRLQITATRKGLTRFVGRQNEMEQLTKALEQAKAGHGQIAGVIGEPCLGKSWLFYEFKLLSLSGCLVLEAYSVSHGKATAYLPVIELLKSYFHIESSDDDRTRREKVAGKVVILDRTLEEVLPYLYALLGIEEQPSPLQHVDAPIRRQRTFAALKKLFLRESLNQPLVLIFEDLHWIDGETQGFLDVLSESVASARLLLLVNYRPEYRHEWGQKTYYTQLRLAPLGKAEAEEFLDALLGTPVGADLRVGPQSPGAHTGAPLQDLKRLILDKTQGAPFFMEEIVQELVEQGVLTQEASGGWVVTQPTTVVQIPTTVQAVLAARIDRLAPEEKALLQRLAIIGRQFSLSLVRRVVTQPEEELYRLLSSLQRKEFLYEQPALPEPEYLFKHALTQEVAYGAVLQEQRKALHERTGQAIEAMFVSRLEDHYSELAHHYSRSGNTEKAIEYLHNAGQQAAQRSAYSEATQQFTQGITLLQTLPETEDRIRREILAQTLLGSVLIVTKGMIAEVGATLARAHALCRRLADPVPLFDVLIGLRGYVCIRGETRKALAYAEQLLQVAQRVQDSGFLLQAHMALSVSYYTLGEFTLARTHSEQGIRLYDPQHHRSHALRYGYDPKMICLFHSSFSLWFLGYLDQAWTRSRELLTFARELAHPYSLAATCWGAGYLHIFRQEESQALAPLAETISLCTEYGMPLFLATSTVLQGLVQVRQGKADEGVRQIQEALMSLDAMEARLSRSVYLAHQAEGYAKLGQVEVGLSLLAQALEFVDTHDERYYEAEVYRLKGQLTLQKFQVPGSNFKDASSRLLTLGPQAEAEAEACFLKAIEIAQKQEAKSLELRASVSLARLWQSQGKEPEARAMLSTIYNWFTEGLDTKDLQEAKSLLKELH